MRIPVVLPRALTAAALVLGLSGCNQLGGASLAPTLRPFSQAPAVAYIEVWPAPPDPMDRTIAAALQPEPDEGNANHVHAHLDVFLDGKPVLVPAGIGINTEDPEVVYFDDNGSYGGIQECAQPCISPLHTHAGFGILHTESETMEPHTLGQFFEEWAVELSSTCVGEHCAPTKPVAFYINGDPYTGDPTEIQLTDGMVIVIVIGTPPAVIPSTADFSKD